jgi:hypothetical protein
MKFLAFMFGLLTLPFMLVRNRGFGFSTDDYWS